MAGARAERSKRSRMFARLWSFLWRVSPRNIVKDNEYRPASRDIWPVIVEFMAGGFNGSGSTAEHFHHTNRCSVLRTPYSVVVVTLLAASPPYSRYLCLYIDMYRVLHIVVIWIRISGYSGSLHLPDSRKWRNLGVFLCYFCYTPYISRSNNLLSISESVWCVLRSWYTLAASRSDAR